MAPPLEIKPRISSSPPLVEPKRKRQKKYRSLKEILEVTQVVENDVVEEKSSLEEKSGVEENDVVGEEEEEEKSSLDEDDDDDDEYKNVTCEQCGSGEKGEELLLCDVCDRGYHMLCLRPIVARVPIGPWFCYGCDDKQKSRPNALIKSKACNFVCCLDVNVMEKWK